jgi:hypothetical protein
MQSLADMGKTDVKKESAIRLLQGAENAHDEELIVMAETAAYFHVAYKVRTPMNAYLDTASTVISQRIIDNIPRIIDHDFLQSIMKEMQKALIKGLDLAGESSSQTAAAYLAEDESVSVRRTELLQKKKRLKAVRDKLTRFSSGA